MDYEPPEVTEEIKKMAVAVKKNIPDNRSFAKWLAPRIDQVVSEQLAHLQNNPSNLLYQAVEEKAMDWEDIALLTAQAYAIMAYHELNTELATEEQIDLAANVIAYATLVELQEVEPELLIRRCMNLQQRLQFYKSALPQA